MDFQERDLPSLAESVQSTKPSSIHQVRGAPAIEKGSPAGVGPAWTLQCCLVFLSSTGLRAVGSGGGTSG